MPRSVLTGSNIQCNHCLWKGRFDDAMASDATITGTHPQNHKITLSCGHSVERQYGRIASAAQGQHSLGCETWREERYALDAIGSGWKLVGTTTPSKTGYRRYAHHCGHFQDHAIVNIDHHQIDCAACVLNCRCSGLMHRRLWHLWRTTAAQTLIPLSAHSE